MSLAELLLLLGVVYLYDIEGRRYLFPVLALAVAGALVHSQLPRSWRLPFFAALSLSTVLFVLGLFNGGLVLAIGGGLIAVCYLPVPFYARVMFLLAAGAALVVWRNGSISPVWPVVGSMFMFRLAIYLYDARRQSIRPSLAETLSYFFMLPNVCFPFFPVIDFRTFRETYYNDDEWVISQRGTSWMLRGITHLLLYRFIKIFLVPEPYEVQDVLTVAVFLLTNYALYLQVSGQFHLITGMLHLFGFNLPRTHDNYFLASSVSDIWRRINIYWKDFMQKLFFLPCFFALRRRGAGMPLAIVCGVFAVFVSTWLLHSWQAYWIAGVFPLRASVAALWLGVGVIVAANSLIEYRRARRSSAADEHGEWARDLVHSAKTVGVLMGVSLFWAGWTRPGFLLRTAGMLWDNPGGSRGIVLVPLCVVGLVVVGAAVRGIARRVRRSDRTGAAHSFRDRFVLHALALGALVAVGLPSFGESAPARVALFLHNMRSEVPVRQDAFARLQSYYEDLNSVTVQAGPLLASLTPEEIEHRLVGDQFAALTRSSGPWTGHELIPGWRGELAGHTVTINQHGMRDRATVTVRKPENVTRIAAVGSSVIMGYAVGDDEVLDLRLEDGLNGRWGGGNERIEVLNFGMGRQGPLHRLALVEQKVLAFDPDALYYFAHQDEFRGSLNHLSGLVSGHIPLKYPFLKEVMRDAGITPETAPGAAFVRLSKPAILQRVLAGVYRTLVDDCRSRGVLPVWIYLPIPGAEEEDDPSDKPSDDPSDELVSLAREAGFVVVDLRDWHAGEAPADLKPGPGDHHLNAKGHRLVAERLLEALARHPEALPAHVTRQPLP